jgi:hypothetical protein
MPQPVSFLEPVAPRCCGQVNTIAIGTSMNAIARRPTAPRAPAARGEDPSDRVRDSGREVEAVDCLADEPQPDADDPSEQSQVRDHRVHRETSGLARGAETPFGPDYSTQAWTASC